MDTKSSDNHVKSSRVRLVLIDGHAILHRAYHALPPLTTSKGELVNAVFGFTSMLLRVIADLKPTHLIVAFDRPEPTFRNKLYKDYQIQRPKADEEFIKQIDLVKKVVNEMDVPIYENAGYEADDIIATLAKQACDEFKIQNSKFKIKDDFETIIVTGDRDILQLINEHVKVYMPIKGLSESKMYGEKEVEDKYGIKPNQIIDYKALIGDPSDNYPGVAGIGPKTASSLLQRYKTLEQIYKHIDTIESDKVKKSLKDNIESVRMAKKLAAIVTDVPIEFDEERCLLPNFDRPNVHYLFEELEFRSLIPRLALDNRQHLTFNIQQKKEEKKQGKANNGQISLF